MSGSLNAFYYAVFVFALVKAFFNLLGWLTQSTSDKVYRRHLDSLYDQLDRESLYQFFLNLQDRFVRLIGETYLLLPAGKVRLAWHVFLLNIVVLVISAEVFELIASKYPSYLYPAELVTRYPPDYYPFKGLQGFIFPSWAPHGTVEPTTTATLRLLGGVVTCIVSFVLSYWLLRKGAQTRRAVGIVVGMLLNIVMIAGFATALSFFFSLSAFIWIQDPSFSFVKFTWFNAGEIILTLYHLLQGRIPENLTAYEFTSALQTMTVALPTLVYVLLSAVAVGVKLTPSPIQQFLKSVVFNLTTDRIPVFTQLGTLAGALAAIGSALVAAIKTN